MKVTNITLSATELTPANIMSLFLWGELTPPAGHYERLKTAEYINSLDDILVDGEDLEVIKVTVDTTEFMQSDAGYYITGADFDIVKDIMTKAPDSGAFEVGQTYSLAEFEAG